MKPNVCILRTDGTNCDEETANACRLAGAEPHLVHMNQFRERTVRLANYQILIIPGGFSYGDDVASGKILALELQTVLHGELQEFQGPILGICNGFQVLVKAKLLPFPQGSDLADAESTLAFNRSGHFQCEPVELAVNPSSPCLFTRKLGPTIVLQIAHGEGQFLTKDPAGIAFLQAQQLISLRYYGKNPNGSMGDVAGLCDPSGRIFGLMPHPERSVVKTQDPNWRRGNRAAPPGLTFFQNAVEFVS